MSPSRNASRPMWLSLVAAAGVMSAAPPARAQSTTLPGSAALQAASTPPTKGSGHDMANMPGMTAPQTSAPAPPMDARPGTNFPRPPDSAAAPGAMGPMQGGPAPADARDPDAYAGGYRRSTMPNPEGADRLRLGALFVDQLEAVTGDRGSGAAWDLQAWYGAPFDRAWLRSEGDVRKGRVEPDSSSVELLWFHLYHPFWGTQVGVRQDLGGGPNRTWLALGLQGTAPYWYGMEATAYVGDEGRTSARLKVAQDLRFTQRLVLRPEVEANLYSRSDPRRELGSGLAWIQTDLRLRYEVRRELAPYIGVSWNHAFGETERLRRAATGKNDEVDFVVGLKVWR